MAYRFNKTVLLYVLRENHHVSVAYMYKTLSFSHALVTYYTQC